jgi:hypothetical protein
MVQPGEQRIDPPRRARGSASGVTRRIATGLRSGWPLVLMFGLVSASAAYVISARAPVRYSASARVFLDGGQISARGAEPVREVLTQSQLAVSTAAVTQVSKQLHLPPTAIIESVTSEAAPNGNYFTVTGVSDTPAGAVALVSAIELAYVDVVGQQARSGGGSALLDQLVQQRVAVGSAYAAARRQLAASPDDSQLQARVAVLAEQVKALTEKENSAFSSADPLGSIVHLVERPQLPEHPSTPRPKRNALLGALVGVLLASTVLWWRSDRLATVGTADVSAATRLPRLAELPGNTRVPWLRRRRRVGRRGLFAEVALAVDVAMPADGRVLLLTSTRPVDLAPEVAAGIARAFAQDRRVILADGHPPALARELESLGVRAGASSIDLGSGIVGMPAEKLSPESLFVTVQEVRGGRQAYSSLVAALRDLADLTIVVVPPPDASLAAVLLASSADAAVLVVCGSTPLSTVVATNDRLGALDCPTLGYVLDRGVNVGPARRGLDWLGRISGREQSVHPRPVCGPGPAGDATDVPGAVPPVDPAPTPAPTVVANAVPTQPAAPAQERTEPVKERAAPVQEHDRPSRRPSRSRRSAG